LDHYDRRSILRPGHLNRSRESGIGGKHINQQKPRAQTAPLKWHIRHNVLRPLTFQEANFNTNLPPEKSSGRVICLFGAL
jgi:hypothetical protein